MNQMIHSQAPKSAYQTFSLKNIKLGDQLLLLKGPDHLGPRTGEFWQISGVFGFFQRAHIFVIF